MIVRIEGVNMIVSIDKGKMKDFCGMAKLLHKCGPQKEGYTTTMIDAMEELHRM